jgi:hypothetical protein
MVTGYFPDLVMWTGGWECGLFKAWIGDNILPAFDSPGVAGWCAHIKNQNTIDQVLYESAHPGGRKTARDKYNRTANALFVQCGLAVEIDAVMVDRQCDARSVSKASGLRILSPNGARYSEPHIGELAIRLYGKQAFDPVGQNVLLPRVRATMLAMFQQAWERQCKDLRSSVDGFDQCLKKARSTIKGVTSCTFRC